MDTFIKYMVVGIVIIGIVLLGLIIYSGNLSQKSMVSSDDTNSKSLIKDFKDTTISYSQGWIENVSESNIKIALEKGSNKKFEEWVLNSETTGSCMADLYTDENGASKKFSETGVVYTNAKNMILDSGWNPKVFVSLSKVNQPVLIFGDRSSMMANTVYLYKDSCP